MKNALIASAVLLVALPNAGRAEESAAAILRKSRERGAINLLDLSAEMKLTTVDKAGEKKEQVVTTAARRVEGRDRTITRFLSPPGVAGVTVLTVEGAKGEGDEISLYLPKLKRVRKVARSQRGESFMQTDFNYADLGATGGTDEASVQRRADAKVEGRDVYVLAGTAGADSPYGQVVAHVDQQTYVPLRVEYSDKDGKPFKVYRTVKQRKFKDRVFAAESVMENLKTGSRTTLEVTRLEDSKLGDDAFTERALERG
ncbi:MAG TPA: outer membrane lipoprotein-sorting protein [Myxococcaceae bacterium]|nr:outer membrane lipoprotein-sorting protein [Myxococcaceae bacterium]